MANKMTAQPGDLENKYKIDPELELAKKEDEREEEKLASELHEISDDDIKIDANFDESEILEEIDEEENREEKSLDSELMSSGEIKEDEEDLEEAENNTGKFEDFYDFKKRYSIRK